MGLGGIGVTQLLIVLAIVVLIFGTKRIAQMGGDLGSMIKGIRGGLKDAEPVVEELQDLKGDLEDFSTKVKGDQTYVRSEIANYDR